MIYNEELKCLIAVDENEKFLIQSIENSERRLREVKLVVEIEENALAFLKNKKLTEYPDEIIPAP